MHAGKPESHEREREDWRQCTSDEEEAPFRNCAESVIAFVVDESNAIGAAGISISLAD